MRPAAEAFGLGLLHGPAELLPVSSSAHLALIGRAPQDAAAVAMHAGTALALVAGLRDEARAALRPANVPWHLVAGAIPSALGAVVARTSALRESPDGLAGARGGSSARGAAGLPMAAGMLAGSAALAWADGARQERSRSEATLVDAAVLGLAQAAALWPGVSRSGATLAAARARGFTRPAAAAISRELSVPLLLGAAAYTATAHGAWAGFPTDVRGKSGPSAPGVGVGAGGLGSFVGTLAALPLLRVLERPLWPWSVYRAGVALALVGRSGRE